MEKYELTKEEEGKNVSISEDVKERKRDNDKDHVDILMKDEFVLRTREIVSCLILYPMQHYTVNTQRHNVIF